MFTKRKVLRAFTIVELVVCIAIVTALISLTTVGVLGVRNSARQLQCAENLRQIGFALQGYSSTCEHLPPGNSFDGSDSPVVPLLPFLEIMLPDTETIQQLPQPPFYSQFFHQPSLLICPGEIHREGTNYRVNTGDTCYPKRFFPAFLSPGRGPFIWRYSQPLRSITDGLTHTAAFGERRIGFSGGGRSVNIDFANIIDVRNRIFPTNSEVDEACGFSNESTYLVFHYAGRDWLNAGFLFSWYNHVRVPNQKGDCIVDGGVSLSLPQGGIVSLSSYHSGGVNLLYLDGRTSFVSNQVDRIVWQAIGSKSGSEVCFEE